MDNPDGRHPVISGLVALVSVGLIVGLILGGAGYAAAKVFGLGSTSTSMASDQETLYLPQPSRTPAAPAPATPTVGTSSPSFPDVSPPAGTKKHQQLTLVAGVSEVGSFAKIPLSGSYGSEGAILQVQRLTDGAWQDFPVTCSVSGGSYSTYVQTGQSGSNEFRMLDTDTQKHSNTVAVTVK